jgi:ubiquinone/menaquinone biosynthesis C-methylase UbiE
MFLRQPRIPNPVSRLTRLVTGPREAELYRRAIGLLNLQLEDLVLEVDCGSGIGVAQAAEIAALGKVCGIESTEALLMEARTRNAEAISSGYVELKAGMPSQLPWPEETFAAAYAVNSPRDWPRPVVNLAEIRRVMQPDGRLAIVIQPPLRTARDGVRDLAELWAHRVDEAGFRDVRFGILRAGRSNAAAITGTA